MQSVQRRPLGHATSHGPYFQGPHLLWWAELLRVDAGENRFLCQCVLNPTVQYGITNALKRLFPVDEATPFIARRKCHRKGGARIGLTDKESPPCRFSKKTVYSALEWIANKGSYSRWTASYVHNSDLNELSGIKSSCDGMDCLHVGVHRNLQAGPILLPLDDVPDDRRCSGDGSPHCDCRCCIHLHCLLFRCPLTRWLWRRPCR